MGRKGRTFTDAFKASVALDAGRGVKTLTELATQYQVHPNQISEWKKQLLRKAPELFSGKINRLAKTEEELTALLYEEIGRLKMDIKWLKNNYEPAGRDSPGLGGAGPALFHASPVHAPRRDAQQFLEMLPILGLHGPLPDQFAAPRERPEKLVVQVVAVRDDHQCRVGHRKVISEPKESTVHPLFAQQINVFFTSRSRRRHIVEPSCSGSMETLSR